jgi:NAD(P)-dependent dehydrogenase (short-subunit alcohol dehydrogenase family)
MKLFEDKVVIVTGAGSGIGRAAAVAFAQEGAKVVVSDVSARGAAEVVEQIKKDNGEAFFISCDVSIEEDVKYLVEKTVQKYGRLDCAYNNAGIEGHAGLTTECTSLDWDHTINTNLKGVWLCMKYEIPEMIKTAKAAL